MTTSLKKQIESGIEFACKNVFKENRPDYSFNLLFEIKQAVMTKLPVGCKILVQTDAERGWNLSVWSPKGRLIKSDHRSGYWVIWALKG